MNYVYTQDQITQAALSVFNPVDEHLSKGERVLLLLSGGSNIKVAVDLGLMLKGIDLSKLYVSLTDERYGPIGHPDENWQQLLDSGLSLPSANLYRPLIGQDIEKTTSEFNGWLNEQFDKADFKIGIFGIGTDGHTAGIKPHSPAVTATDLATSYTSDDFQRVTISFSAIEGLDEAVVQASGPDKIPVLHTLLNENVPSDVQPSQILKKIPKVTIFSNNPKEVIR